MWSVKRSVVARSNRISFCTKRFPQSWPLDSRKNIIFWALTQFWQSNFPWNLVYLTIAFHTFRTFNVVCVIFTMSFRLYRSLNLIKIDTQFDVYYLVINGAKINGNGNCNSFSKRSAKLNEPIRVVPFVIKTN